MVKKFKNGKKCIALSLALLLMFSVFMPLGIYAEVGDEESVEEKIERIAKERGVPAVIVKSIAQIESSLSQFYNNGDIKISYSGNIGLMQVGNNHGMFDNERLKYDIDYNIEAGIEVLLMKWSSSVQNYTISSVGNMDPNILENWYFTIWAYNGWASSNNPNSNQKAYQTKLYDIAEDMFGQVITPIDLYYLPAYGTPPKKLNVPTPENSHSANIYQFKVGDIVSVNTILNDRYLSTEPGSGAFVQVLHGENAKILEEPILHEGYYWYKIQTDSGHTGWIQRNWIKKIGDTENGIYPFKDIIYHWSAGSIMDLYNSDLVSGKADNMYFVDELITKEEYFGLLAKTIMSLDDETEEILDTEIDEDLENDEGQDKNLKEENSENSENSEEDAKKDADHEEYSEDSTDSVEAPIVESKEEEVGLRFADSDSISSWAKKYVVYLDEAMLLKEYVNYLHPKEAMSRGELTDLIANYLIMEAENQFIAELEAMKSDLEEDANENNDEEDKDEEDEVKDEEDKDDDNNAVSAAEDEKENAENTDEMNAEFYLYDEFELHEIELEFEDVSGLTQEQIDNIKLMISLDIISGKSAKEYGHDELLSRAEAAAVTNKLLDYLNSKTYESEEVSETAAPQSVEEAAAEEKVVNAEETEKNNKNE